MSRRRKPRILQPRVNRAAFDAAMASLPAEFVWLGWGSEVPTSDELAAAETAELEGTAMPWPPAALIRDRLQAAIVIDDRGCWIWQRPLNHHGYGMIRVGERVCRAHRVAYETHIGPIPDGMQLDHLCRVRACINPEHLEPVTARENQLRGDTLTAANLAKTHCPQGHPYEGENLLVSPDGRKRYCRQCAREKERIRRAAMKNESAEFDPRPEPEAAPASLLDLRPDDTQFLSVRDFVLGTEFPINADRAEVATC